MFFSVGSGPPVPLPGSAHGLDPGISTSCAALHFYVRQFVNRISREEKKLETDVNDGCISFLYRMFLYSADFYFLFFFKNLSGVPQEFGSRSGSMFFSRMVWVQTVCKDLQQIKIAKS